MSGTMKSSGLAHGYGQYDMNCTWWWEVVLDSIRCGRARSQMPGTRFSWHVILWNRAVAEESYHWPSNFYISSYGLWDSLVWCLLSSIFYRLSYESHVSWRPGTLSSVWTDHVIRWGRLGAIGHLTSCTDCIFSYSWLASVLTSSSCTSCCSSSSASYLLSW